MASYSMGDLKKGLKIEIDGVPYKIVEYQHVKPGKGAAFVRAKIKSFVDGKVLEKTFHAGDKCEQPHLEEKEMQYLYDDGEFCQFMDTTTYEQVAISDEDVGDVKKWMIDGMMVEILFHNGNAIGVEVPQVVIHALKLALCITLSDDVLNSCSTNALNRSKSKYNAIVTLIFNDAKFFG